MTKFEDLLTKQKNFNEAIDKQIKELELHRFRQNSSFEDDLYMSLSYEDETESEILDILEENNICFNLILALFRKNNIDYSKPIYFLMALTEFIESPEEYITGYDEIFDYRCDYTKIYFTASKNGKTVKKCIYEINGDLFTEDN